MAGAVTARRAGSIIAVYVHALSRYARTAEYGDKFAKSVVKLKTTMFLDILQLAVSVGAIGEPKLLKPV